MRAWDEKRAMAKELQAKINALQGLGKLSGELPVAGLSPFATAFPGHAFPINAIHEFISCGPAAAASTNGFITALAGKFMEDGAICLWIGSKKKIYPPGLKYFGLDPSRVVFITAMKLQDTLWIIEEALKCEALTAVIAEIPELGFAESRRLQLAVERSGVTGFIHRISPHIENATACTARWQITPMPGIAPDGLPGIGHSRWDVQLLKIKNGRPHSWQVSWSGGSFVQVVENTLSIPTHQRNAV